MLYTLWYDFITKYKEIVGAGSILTLFVVSLGLITVIKYKKEEKTSLILYFLSVWATIGIAVAKVFDAFINREYKSRLEKTMVLTIVLVISTFAILISGERILAPDYYIKAENTMHIANDLRDTMDFILNDSIGTAGIVTMPEYGEYFTAYSSEFYLAYEDPIYSDDIAGYPENARNAYVELGKQYPDMSKVAKLAKDTECRYIVLKNDAYWPRTRLEDLGYGIVNSCGEWVVYKVNAGGDI